MTSAAWVILAFALAATRPAAAAAAAVERAASEPGVSLRRVMDDLAAAVAEVHAAIAELQHAD